MIQKDRETTYTYEPSTSFLQKIVDPADRSSRFLYDPVGRPTMQELADLSQIGFSYDRNGNLKTLTPPSRPVHTFHYNEVNLAEGYVPPAVLEGGNSIVEYNQDRQPEVVTRPAGDTINFIYDELDFGVPDDLNTGKLEQVVSAIGTASYGYYEGTGRLATIDSAAADLDLTYTYNGPLLESVSWSGEFDSSVEFAYTHDLKLESIKSGATIIASYEYDDDLLLETAGDLDLHRDAATGFLTGTSLGDIDDSYVFDPDYGELSDYAAKYLGVDFFREAILTRDDLGRIVARSETKTSPGGTPTTHTYDYEYDAVGRLKKVRRNGNIVEQYLYDNNGNRLGANVVGLPQAHPSDTEIDDQDRLLQYGTTSFTYAPDGSLETRSSNGQTVQYAYDEFGGLRQVVLETGIEIDYLHDGQRRRVGKAVDGVVVKRWIYRDQLNVVAEVAQNGTLVAQFVYGTKPHVPDYMVAAGRTYRFVTDHLGSVRMVVRSDGVQSDEELIVQEIDYDGFGRVVFDSNPGFQPFGFAGGLYDHQTGLVRFGVRDYDPTLGRWTAKDPILFAGGDTNLYGYAANDPINRLDPSGNAVDAFADIAFIGYDVYKLIKNLLSACPDASLGEDLTTLGLDVVGLAIPFATGLGRASKTGRAVIGKLDDIKPGKLRPGEHTLLAHMPHDLGSPRANWAQNASVLRRELRKGNPIRDATVNPRTGQLANNTGFLRAERNLMRNQNWTYNPSTTLWSPPGP